MYLEESQKVKSDSKLVKTDKKKARLKLGQKLGRNGGSRNFGPTREIMSNRRGLATFWENMAHVWSKRSSVKLINTLVFDL